MKAFLWVFGVCAALFVLTYLFKDNIRRQFLSNKVLLQTRGPINPKTVRIDWTTETKEDTITVFEAGDETNAVFEAAGPNHFLMYYNGQLVADFEHHKTAAVLPHTYTFQLGQERDSLYADLKIFGPEANL